MSTGAATVAAGAFTIARGSAATSAMRFLPVVSLFEGEMEDVIGVLTKNKPAKAAASHGFTLSPSPLSPFTYQNPPNSSTAHPVTCMSMSRAASPAPVVKGQSCVSVPAKTRLAHQSSCLECSLPGKTRSSTKMLKAK